MVCVCVCVKIHDIESGSRGPLLLHYTVCERHDINSMQIRTVRAVRIINHGKLASFPSFFSSIRRRFRHRSLRPTVATIFQIRVVSRSIERRRSRGECLESSVQGSRLWRKSMTAPLITPFRADLSDTMGYSYETNSNTRRSRRGSRSWLHDPRGRNDLCFGMVEITVINELAFPTSSIRRRKDISMAARIMPWC